MIKYTLFLGLYPRILTAENMHKHRFPWVSTFAFSHFTCCTYREKIHVHTCAHLNTLHILSDGMNYTCNLTIAPSRLQGSATGKVKGLNICLLTAALGTKRCCLTTSALDRLKKEKILNRCYLWKKKIEEETCSKWLI